MPSRSNRLSRFQSGWLPYCRVFWRGGFHELADYGTHHDPNLYLIHLHRMDYGICLKRHQRCKSHQRAQDDMDKSRGYQHRIIGSDKFHRWFYNDRAADKPIHPEPISAHWQQVLCTCNARTAAPTRPL